MQKRGFSHIEMVLAFLIFISVLFFSLYFLSIGSSSNLAKSSLEYSEDALLKNISVNIESYSLRLVSSAGVIAIDMPAGVSGGSSVKGNNGIKVDSVLENNKLYFKPSTESFYTIYISEEIKKVDPFTERPAVDKSKYDLAESNKIKVFSEKRMLELNKSYHLDYGEFQKVFSLGQNVNLGYNMIFSDSDFIIIDREIPENTDVFAISTRGEVIRTSGDIIFADLITKVW